MANTVARHFGGTTRTISDAEYQHTRSSRTHSPELFLSTSTVRLQGAPALASMEEPVAFVFGYEDLTLSLKRRLHDLLMLGAPNWDGYGAAPVDEDAARKALFLVLELADHMGGYEMPLPELYPLTDGGVRIEWRTEDKEASIDVLPANEPSLYFCDDVAGQEWEGPLGASVFELLSVLTAMADDSPTA